MGFAALFHDMMKDRVTITPGVVDEYGNFAATGAAIEDVICRITGQRKMLRDLTGRERMSTVTIVLGSFVGVDPALHRVTLPTKFNPRENLEIIGVQKVADEIESECFEKLYLP